MQAALALKPLLHFHSFCPGLLRFGTVVTAAMFGPGSMLSTVLLRCSYGARGRSTEDLFQSIPIYSSSRVNWKHSCSSSPEPFCGSISNEGPYKYSLLLLLLLLLLLHYYGYALDMLRNCPGCAKVYHSFLKVVLRHHRMSHEWATAVIRFVPDMLLCYGKATDLLRIFYGYVTVLSRSLVVWSFIPI